MGVALAFSELERLLGNVIRCRDALRALDHVIHKAKLFNSGRFPLTVEYIGIGGSSLDSDEVADIDIVLCCSGRPEYFDDWLAFKRLLHEKFGIIWGIIVNLMDYVPKVTINHVIDYYRKNLADIGFKDWWINEWFTWLRISDFRYGIERGVPLVRFSLRELVERFFKHKWIGKRLEMHLKIIDGAGKKIRDFMETDIPYVIVWRRNAGLVVPSNRELLDFFRREYYELTDIATKILQNRFHELPPVYWDIEHALKAKSPSPIFLNEFMKICLETIGKIMDRAKEMIKERISKLTTMPSPREDVNSLMESCRNLRNTIKEILALKYIINTLADYMPIEKAAHKAHGDINEFLKQLKNYIVRNGPRHGYNRFILRKLVSELIIQDTHTITRR